DATYQRTRALVR
nr:Chain C, influenza A NP145-156 peptide [unidentified influenza virus]